MVHPAGELFSSVWADQYHCQDWLNMHPACESLSSVWAGQYHWHKWMMEHMSRMWVTLKCSSTADQNHWWEPLNTHSASELLSNLDQNHWQEQLNTHPASESLSSVWPDQNHWWAWLNIKYLQDVSWSPVFKQITTTDKNGWTCLQLVSCFPMFEKINTTDKNTYASSLWVTLQFLNRSLAEPLMRTTEHLGSESLSSVWADQNHWREWLNMHPGCESLSCVRANQNHWQEWLNT